MYVNEKKEKKEYEQVVINDAKKTEKKIDIVDRRRSRKRKKSWNQV